VQVVGGPRREQRPRALEDVRRVGRHRAGQLREREVALALQQLAVGQLLGAAARVVVHEHRAERVERPDEDLGVHLGPGRAVHLERRDHVLDAAQPDARHPPHAHAGDLDGVALHEAGDVRELHPERHGAAPEDRLPREVGQPADHHRESGDDQQADGHFLLVMQIHTAPVLTCPSCRRNRAR
jgi:hypothetical protein